MALRSWLPVNVVYATDLRGFCESEVARAVAGVQQGPPLPPLCDRIHTTKNSRKSCFSISADVFALVKCGHGT